MMLVHLFPPGMLALWLTAILASFTSGMAGSTTAFNTVWTYDIHQSYINPGASDAHCPWMGRVAIVGAIVIPGRGSLIPSELPQTYCTAIVARVTCLAVSIIVRLAPRPHEPDELRGHVYSLTLRPYDEGLARYARPCVLAACVIGLTHST